jgi:GNS1/SUR4 family.
MGFITKNFHASTPHLVTCTQSKLFFDSILTLDKISIQYEDSCSVLMGRSITTNQQTRLKFHDNGFHLSSRRHCYLLISLFDMTFIQQSRWEKFYDPIPGITWMQKHPEIPVVALVAYAVLIVLGRKAMETREPWKWRNILAAWNLMLSLSFHGLGHFERHLNCYIISSTFLFVTIFAWILKLLTGRDLRDFGCSCLF